MKKTISILIISLAFMLGACAGGNVVGPGCGCSTKNCICDVNCYCAGVDDGKGELRCDCKK